MILPSVPIHLPQHAASFFFPRMYDTSLSIVQTHVFGVQCCSQMTTQSRLIVGSCDDSFEDSGKRKEAARCVCGSVQGQRVGGSATFAAVHYEIANYNRPKTGQVQHETSQHALQVIHRSLINTFNGCLTAPTFKSNVFISNNSRAYSSTP